MFDHYRTRIYVIPQPGMCETKCLDVADVVIGKDEWRYGMPPKMLTHGADLYDCLVDAGCFPSKSQARKNWKKPAVLEHGLNEVRCGRALLWIVKAPAIA